MTKTVHADSEPLLLVVSVGGVCDLHIRLGFQAHLSRVEREEKIKGEQCRVANNPQEGPEKFILFGLVSLINFILVQIDRNQIQFFF